MRNCEKALCFQSFINLRASNRTTHVDIRKIDFDKWSDMLDKVILPDCREEHNGTMVCATYSPIGPSKTNMLGSVSLKCIFEKTSDVISKISDHFISIHKRYN